MTDTLQDKFVKKIKTHSVFSNFFLIVTFMR